MFPQQDVDVLRTNYQKKGWNIKSICREFSTQGWNNRIALTMLWYCIFFSVFYCFYIVLIIVLYSIRPSSVLFSYSAFGCKSVLLNQSIDALGKRGPCATVTIEQLKAPLKRYWVWSRQT